MNTVKPFGLAIAICVQAMLIFSGLWTVHAAPTAQRAPKAAKAPPLHECKVTATGDLGLWDDVFVPPDQDFIVLRRGDELFSLAMAASATPKKIAKAPAVVNTQVIAGAAVDKKLWLFLNSSKASPCAVDAHSGAAATFEIPELKVPGSHAPGIQSCVIVPHVQAAVLMISGGDRATWPRDGNRPVYFWMDLKSGKVVRFPIGWDLHYFSADERIAVFAKPVEKQFDKGRLQAVDMKTGERIDAVPDRRKERFIDFDWQNTQKVKPVREWQEKKGDTFAGLSIGGLVVPDTLGLEHKQYPVMVAKAAEGFAGFRLRRSGAANGEPIPLWIVPLNDPKKTESIATGVTDFSMLGKGNVVFATFVQEDKRPPSEIRHHAEAFFHARADRTSWNVLDGVERLPKLDKAFADAGFVTDSMTVRFIEGFGGSGHEPLVLCVCNHHRGDLRANPGPIDGKVLESVTWRRALVITGGGKRALTPLFREGKFPDQIWLHKSGKLITGTYVWHQADSGRQRRVQLSERTLQKP